MVRHKPVQIRDAPPRPHRDWNQGRVIIESLGVVMEKKKDENGNIQEAKLKNTGKKPAEEVPTRGLVVPAVVVSEFPGPVAA